MTEAVQTKFTSSIAWSILSRWSSKLLGMVNTVVLARILAPEDFGIVAMATIVITMLESMTQVGIHLYTIRHKDDDPRVFNTGWTVNFLQSLLIAILLFISAPYIAAFFKEPAVEAIVYCLAAIKAMKGFENFAIFIAQKQLDFNFDFKLTLYTRLTYTVATIAFALWLENYWAIVIGQGISVFIGCILSYTMHPFRPKFQLYQWRKVFEFSKSMIPLSTGRFVNNQLDVTVIGRVSSAAYLGQYHIAANLASLFTKELMLPFIRGLVPNLSKLKGTPQFNDVLTLVIAGAVYIFLPLGFGLAAVSTEFVSVLLGDNWLPAAPILAWLSLYAMLSGITMFVSEQFLVILDQEKLSNRLMWFRNIILIAAIVAVLYWANYELIPQAMVASALVCLPIIVWFVTRKLALSKMRLFSHTWSALLAGGIMVLGIDFISLSDWPVIVQLLIKVAVGGLLYVGTIALLYIIRGKPTGTPEELLMKKILKKE